MRISGDAKRTPGWAFLIGASLLLIVLAFSQCSHPPPTETPSEVTPPETPPAIIEESGPYNILSYSVDVRRNGILIEVLLREPLHYEWFLTDDEWINLTFDHGRLDPGKMKSIRPHAEVLEVSAHQFDSSAQLSFRMSNPVEKYIVTTDPYSSKRILVMITGSSRGMIPGGGLPVKPSESQWVVVLDPGHGGRDAGCVGSAKKTLEKTIMLSIAQRAAKLFEKDPDFRVYVTRRGDNNPSDAARSRVARQANANMFISLHTNSSKRSSVRGCKAYYFDGAPSARRSIPVGSQVPATGVQSAQGRPSSTDLAQEIMDKIATSIQVPCLGVERRKFSALAATGRTAVRVTTGFMSNPADEALLRKKSYQQRIAEAIYLGAVAYRDKYLHRELTSTDR